MDEEDAQGHVLLLDTSAFILGYMATDTNAEHYSVPAVRDELIEGSLNRLRFDNAVGTGHLKVLDPAPKFSEELREVTREMGEEGVVRNRQAATGSGFITVVSREGINCGI